MNTPSGLPATKMPIIRPIVAPPTQPRPALAGLGGGPGAGLLALGSSLAGPAGGGGGQQGFRGQSSLLPYPQTSDTDVEPANKKQKTEADALLASLIPEATFLDSNPANLTIMVQVPLVDSASASGKTSQNWNLNGQTIQFDVSLRDTISHIKEKIKDALGMPLNKQNLKCSGLPFLKDQNSLAFYNMKDGTNLQLTVKERGGRK
jgi:splicing factor 3A subunit 1